ncbi:hypothetical protein Tco_1426934, partial [Tanacetum coccineum]
MFVYIDSIRRKVVHSQGGRGDARTKIQRNGIFFNKTVDIINSQVGSIGVHVEFRKDRFTGRLRSGRHVVQGKGEIKRINVRRTKHTWEKKNPDEGPREVFSKESKTVKRGEDPKDFRTKGSRDSSKRSEKGPWKWPKKPTSSDSYDSIGAVGLLVLNSWDLNGVKLDCLVTLGLLPNFEKVQAASLKPNLCCIQPPSLVTLLRGYIMDDLVQDFFIRPEGNTFDLDVYESYTNLFTIKCHYYGKFNDGPKKEYIEGETCFVDLVNRDQFTDVVLNTVINSLGYEMEDEVLYWYKIPLKSLDVGLKPLVSESDYRRFLGYVEKHKVMDVYVEIVEKNEESKSGSNSASESDNDFEDEEHVVQEVKVNMGDFN